MSISLRISNAAAALLLPILLLSGVAHGQSRGQLASSEASPVTLGNWQVHYSAFPTTMLRPEMTQRYNIRRSNARGLVNISVLDGRTQQAQRVVLSGYALNELGQRRDLDFRRYIDGTGDFEAIYYIAEVPHGQRETYRFFISIAQGDQQQELRFRHTFVRE